MSNYKWNIEEITEDINKIKIIASKKNLNSEEIINIVDDLDKLRYMLTNVNNFNRPKRASYIYTIVDNSIKSLNYDNIIIDNNEANNLQNIKNIINISSNMVNNIKPYNLKRKRKNYQKKTNEHEIIYIIREMLNDYDPLLREDFDQFIESNHLKISNNSSNSNTDVKSLKTLSKAYVSVKKCDNLGCVDDLLYGYIKSKMFELNSNRNISIYNKALEIFFTLLATDKIKEKGYNDYYSVRLNIYHHFLNWLPEFDYVTRQGKDLKYDTQKNKYIIKHTSSLFDDELSEIYNNGQSYKTIMKPFIMIHSNILAFNLYEQYKLNKEATKDIINNLFNIIGIVNDEEIFKYINNYNSSNTLLNRQQEDYKQIKKRRKFILK